MSNMKITHESMEPFFVKVELPNHTLYQKRLNKNGEEVEDLIGYYSSLEGALRKIVRLRMVEGQDHITLDAYIKKLEKEVDKLID